MRLMLHENPGLATKANCFVDGVDVSARCYGADEELGEAYCYVMNENHLTAVDHTADCQASNQTRCTLGEPNGCDMRRETLKGNVRIELG